QILNTNLSKYTNVLVKLFLIDRFDESKFKKPAECNYIYRYHELTDIGKELIAPLPLKYRE
ncbi:MAG: hypothetical protein JSU85_10750, partial [Candidatus Zixiibacteriota bacterium]